MIFDDLIAELGPRDTLVHLGPSTLHERFGYYRNTKCRVVIAEPDPVRAAKFRRSVSGAANIELIECAVVAVMRDAELYRCNFDALTGLCDPAALKILFPGLRVSERIAVDAMPVASLTAKLAPNHREKDLLVIDSLNEGFELLKELDVQGVLTRYANMVLRTARLPRANNKDSIITMVEWLAVRGFDRPVMLDSTDPDVPVIGLQRNPLRGDLEQQKVLVESLRREQETMQTALAEANAEMRVSMRMQSAAYDDLKDLQRQYAVLRAGKDRQDELLQKVTQKLAYASDYLRQLANDSPEFARMLESTRRESDDEIEDAAHMSFDEQIHLATHEDDAVDPTDGGAD